MNGKSYPKTKILAITIVALALILCLGGALAHPQSWHVDDDLKDYPGAKFTKIQDAIDGASEGDEIIVHPGTYRENVVVNKKVTLKGIDHPTVDASLKGSAVVIDVNGCVLDGFKAVNSEWAKDLEVLNAGILVKSDKNLITGNDVSDNFSGILLSNSSNNTITGNDLSKNLIGIFLVDSSDNTITGNNTSSNYKLGIDLVDSSDNTITGNYVSTNEYGIGLAFSSNNTLKKNEMRDNKYNFGVDGVELSHYIQEIDRSNTVDGRPIYYLVNETDKTISSDSNAGYVAAINCRNIVVNDLTLTNNVSGVLFVHTKDSKIENVDISKNFIGVFFSDSSNNTITANDVSKNYSGINLDDSSNDNLFYHNNLIDNTVQASDRGKNSWDAGSTEGGNHWSNHRCRGNPNDGEPYQINSDSIDHYPFEDRNGWDGISRFWFLPPMLIAIFVIALIVILIRRP